MFAAGEEYFEMKEKNSNLRYSDSYNPKKKFYPEQVEQPGPSLIDSKFLVRHQEKIEILSRKIEEFERAKTKKFKEIPRVEVIESIPWDGNVEKNSAQKFTNESLALQAWKMLKEIVLEEAPKDKKIKLKSLPILPTRHHFEKAIQISNDETLKKTFLLFKEFGMNSLHQKSFMKRFERYYAALEDPNDEVLTIRPTRQHIKKAIRYSSSDSDVHNLLSKLTKNDELPYTKNAFMNYFKHSKYIKDDQLLNRVWETVKKVISNERLDERWKLVERIQNQICSKNSKLVPIGSMVTGLATDLNSSDIDLCFVSNESKFLEDFYKYPDFRRFFMKKMADLLELMGKDDPNLEFSQPATFLPDAHTPLVEVSFKNGMSLDIAFPKNDYHSLRNTNLMKLYVAADPRFPQLYLWFRTLLQSLGIRNSKEGLLSSYHVQLLVVHFLQCYMINNPTVLPILCKTHPNLVTNDLKIDEVIERIEDFGVKIQDWKSANTMSVGELAIRLIEYYKNFPVHEDVILIESGRVIKRKQHRASTRLQILDPYSSVTVARSDLIPWAFRDGMKFIHLEMLQGRMIDSFPEFPEAREFQFDPRRALNVDENVQE